jgi:hypothetical protein
MERKKENPPDKFELFCQLVLKRRKKYCLLPNKFCWKFDGKRSRWKLKRRKSERLTSSETSIWLDFAYRWRIRKFANNYDIIDLYKLILDTIHIHPLLPFKFIIPNGKLFEICSQLYDWKPIKSVGET